MQWTQTNSWDNFPAEHPEPRPKRTRKPASAPPTPSSLPVVKPALGSSLSLPQNVHLALFGAVLLLGCYLVGGRSTTADTATLGIGSAVASKRTTATIDSPDSAAPRSSGQITDEVGNAYINRYAPLAQQEQERFNVLASIQLAQGLIESTGGTSTGARKAKNHFGIKCFAKRHKWCCLKAHDDSNSDGFVVYDSEWSCWRAHSKLLAGARYGQLIGQSAQGWATGLQRLGYATDKRYAEKLMAMVDRFDLTRFDR